MAKTSKIRGEYTEEDLNNRFNKSSDRQKSEFWDFTKLICDGYLSVNGYKNVYDRVLSNSKREVESGRRELEGEKKNEQ
ncbi:unnamed protein product [Caenorhabditis nigoni]